MVYNYGMFVGKLTLPFASPFISNCFVNEVAIVLSYLYRHLARTGQQEEMKATADDVELLSVSVHEATTDYYVRLSVPEDGASEQDSMHIKLEYVKL